MTTDFDHLDNYHISSDRSTPFEAVKKDTLAGEAEFFIDIVPLGGLCGQCGNQFVTDGAYILECPFCFSTSFKINQGHELELVELEAI